MLLVLLSFWEGGAFLQSSSNHDTQVPAALAGGALAPACRGLTDLLRALHISMVTRTDSAIVIGYGDSKIAQSTPSKSGLSSLHCRKWLCNKCPIKFLISQVHFQGPWPCSTGSPVHRPTQDLTPSPREALGPQNHLRFNCLFFEC